MCGGREVIARPTPHHIAEKCSTAAGGSPKLWCRHIFGDIGKLAEEVWSILLFCHALGGIGRELEVGLAKTVISVYIYSTMESHRRCVWPRL